LILCGIYFDTFGFNGFQKGFVLRERGTGPSFPSFQGKKSKDIAVEGFQWFEIFS